MGRRKKPEEHAHAESWLVSYCDMISLLVTFFLMMMTFSTKDELDVREVGVGLLNGRGGIWDNPMYFPLEGEVEPGVVSSLARDLAALNEQQLGEQQTSIQPTLDGFKMSFDLRSSFSPGSATVNEALAQNLLILATALKRYAYQTIVEGFTDDRFQATPEFPTAEALGAARALAAARVILENSTIAPELLQISSHGMLRPRAPNDTAMGRTSNRRVEVRVVALARSSGVGSGKEAR
jgi:chemotaxis protein MotB